jgi:hypothetical protein
MTTSDIQKIPELPDLLQRLQAMTCYLPALEDPDFSPGEIHSGEKTESGILIMPYVVLGEVAEAFVASAYDRGWVLPGFHWVSWCESDAAQALCRDPSALARAEPMQLLYLTTALIRQDRFSEGTLLNAFRGGLVLGIVRRAIAILDDEQSRMQS